MSAVTLGVLRMPEELVLASELSKQQFFARAASAADDIEALQAENDKLREALGFYADEGTWKTRGHPQIDADTKPILHDGGNRARAALSPTPPKGETE